ncbi:MAG TPA: TIGR01777 family oxidoreductase [Solirubrobacteraceae bacterium]|nr:TIGR01777 family oxidoreductase [Solirubrobacteraceae bacterium]
MSSQRVTVTGATGLLGAPLVAALLARGAEVTVLSRDPGRARQRLGEVQALHWDPLAEAAPAEALQGRDAVLHLAGEPVAQRWSARAKQAIRDSRVIGTRNLVGALGALPAPVPVLISSSAIGIYGSRGEEPLDEEAPAGRGFLAEVCQEWEQEADRAAELGVRVVCVRTGVVLDRGGGALGRMLVPFRLGVGGPVAGGRQYISWIHIADVVGLMLAALDRHEWSGPINATAPDPVTNRDFARALGRALHRPALLPVPGLALGALYGEMASIITTGARVVPAKPLVLGYEFRHPRLAKALEAALAS